MMEWQGISFRIPVQLLISGLLAFYTDCNYQERASLAYLIGY